MSVSSSRTTFDLSKWQAAFYKTKTATRMDKMMHRFVGLFRIAFEPRQVVVAIHLLANTPSIQYIVFDGKPSKDVIDRIHAVRDTIQVFSLDKLCEIGRALPLDALDTRRPTADSLVLIMYTSSSTGAPNGVHIAHANLVASVGSMYKLLVPT
ncbi:hypothetical protein BJ912DRAFT_608364 [Pholiota molesta]|nr:hypothetical protein BJ912DRAFT_608364 [Pholiota molesta]